MHLKRAIKVVLTIQDVLFRDECMQVAWFCLMDLSELGLILVYDSWEPMGAKEQIIDYILTVFIWPWSET